MSPRFQLTHNAGAKKGNENTCLIPSRGSVSEEIGNAARSCESMIDSKNSGPIDHEQLFEAELVLWARSRVQRHFHEKESCHERETKYFGAISTFSMIDGQMFIGISF
jgi:hypothetical protein